MRQSSICPDAVKDFLDFWTFFPNKKTPNNEDLGFYMCFGVMEYEDKFLK